MLCDLGIKNTRFSETLAVLRNAARALRLIITRAANVADFFLDSLLTRYFLQNHDRAHIFTTRDVRAAGGSLMHARRIIILVREAIRIGKKNIIKPHCAESQIKLLLRSYRGSFVFIHVLGCATRFEYVRPHIGGTHNNESDKIKSSVKSIAATRRRGNNF